MTNEPLITCEHVSVAYGQQEVLKDVCLRIPHSVFLPVSGPNGAGKTTLLRAILGLVPLRRGRIHANFGSVPPGYVPQLKAIDPLYPVNVRQIVNMGLTARNGWWRGPNRRQSEQVSALLERFVLLEHENKTFRELSGGMKQKTLVARALATGSSTLILDEPTAELDEDTECFVMRELARLVREQGLTVLLAHHGLEGLRPYAQTVCRVDHGRAWIETFDNAEPTRAARAEAAAGRDATATKPGGAAQRPAAGD